MPRSKKQLPQRKPKAEEAPKRRWKKRDMKKASDSFKEQVGSEGADPRLAEDKSVTPNALVYKNSVEAIISRPALVKQSYWTPLLSILSQAFSKGFMASAQGGADPFAPYYAFVYLVQALESAINDSDPPFTTAPLWFVILYQALRPGKAKFRTGTIDYKFVVDRAGPDGFGSIPMSSIPWFAPDTKWAFGSVDGNGLNVNGYLVLVPPTPYTVDLGQTSWSLLVQYFANEKRYPMWNLVEVTTPVFRKGDTSAYAAAFNEVGGAIGATTGFVTEVFSEVFIQSPVLAVFSSYEQNSFRTFSHCRQFGGSGCYLGARLQELQKTGEVRNKVRPMFKFIDFNEFYEVAALWLAGALGLTSGNVLQQEDASSILICPLSVQDFRILLRQAIMSMFEDSQSMAQDLIYTGVDTFYPFLVSTGCCGKSPANAMLLLIIMVENLRALLRRTARAKSRDGSNTGQMVDFVPVWGMWSSDIPKITNYEYTGNQGVVSPVFSAPAPSDVPINLIDGSAQVGTPAVYTPIDLNGNELSVSLKEWNDFVSKTLAANVCTLSPIGSELGIAALEVITMSELMFPIPLAPPEQPIPSVSLTKVTPIMGRKLSIEKIVNLGRKPRSLFIVGAQDGPIGGVTASPYAAWSTNFLCSNQKIVATAWSECQIYWILPTSRTTGDPNDAQNYAAYQSQQAEPNGFYLGASGSSTTITSPIGVAPTYLRHQTYASTMYGPAAAKSNILEDFLTQAATTGRGGFLGKLVGGFLGGMVGQGELGAELGDEIL